MTRARRGVILALVKPSVGPSLELAFLLTDAFGEISLRALRAVWDRWIGPQRFHRKLAQLEHAGWLQDGRDAADTERVRRFTALGRRMALGGRDPEERWNRGWDGRWRLVLFDVPESNGALRAALRRKLCALGFGYLQNSAWISPDPLDELRGAIGNAAIDVETLSFMEARPCAGESDADIVLGAWNFERINRNYELYCDLLKCRPSRLSPPALRREWLKAEWRAWWHAIRADPLLPAQLLPASYRGRHAWQRRTVALRHLARP